MTEYTGPIGKANVLESFREYTEPFIVLDYADSDFEEKSLDFMSDQRRLDSHSQFLLRSGGTFEGMLPFYDERFGCYVGRTFAGLMDSEDCRDFNVGFKKYDFDILKLRDVIASRFFNAGGGSELERKLFFENTNDSELLNNVEMLGSKSVEKLRNYSESRLVDLSEHSMKFILQKRIAGLTIHVMEHPNFEDLLHIDDVYDYGDDFEFFVFPKHETFFENLGDLTVSRKEKNRFLKLAKRNIDIFSNLYYEAVKDLHPNFTYLVEFILGFDYNAVPVQATPIFRKNPQTRNLIGQDLTGLRVNLTNEYVEADLDNTNYENRVELAQINLDFRGRVLSQAKTGEILSHYNVRALEGIKSIGVGVKTYMTRLD